MASELDILPPGRFAPESLLSARALPNTVLASSVDAGWTALLLEHHLSRGQSAPFTTMATPDQTIVVATRGDHEIECQVQGRWRKAIYRPGCAGMTPGGDTARLRWRSRGGTGEFTTAHLYLPQFYFDDAAEHYCRAGQRLRTEALNALAFDDATVAQTVHALLAGMAAGAPDLYAQAAAQWLALHMLSRHSRWIDLDNDRRNTGMLSDRRLVRVIDYLSTHFAQNLSVSELAAEASISKFHFVRLFREKTGSTPHAYLLALRIDAAKRMLAATDLSVSEVAHACGFSGPSHFGTAFAKALGMTPTRFRRQTHGMRAS